MYLIINVCLTLEIMLGSWNNFFSYYLQYIKLAINKMIGVTNILSKKTVHCLVFNYILGR